MKPIQMVKVPRPYLSLGELKELVILLENQETNEAYKGVDLSINGDYANIDVTIDDLGNVILL